ncbi:hypothetical protein HFP51_04580 [Parasphingopyxis sp. CP4]|uniref:hypothetical protein n=1 Tax=Parasphingopyxis sp. CP4 TaxID=2724527 RepID=UPI00159FB040|nr:hypothetical protein [Parasphingopyxis sp. CP4]QLC21515.1 hypothetical protein HFP51_04580 [Parasphingopyxis sp. CP4]
MKRVSTMGLAAAMVFGGSAVIATAPAMAVQAAEEAEEFDPGEISEGVRAVVVGAQTALDAEEGPVDTAAILAQLQAAVPTVQNQDDRFILGSLLLQTAAKIQEQGGTAEQIQAVQIPGLRLSLDSNRVAIERRPVFWLAVGNAANAAEDSAAAIEAYQNVLRYDPTNGDALIQSALAHFRTNNSAAGYDSASRAFAALRAAGQVVPQSWHTVPFRQAYQTNDVARVVEFGTSLLQSHPTPQNWNEVLRVLQTAGRLEDQPNLDLLRLMRATGGLDPNSINEYIRLADQRGLPREAQAIYDGSVAGGAIVANQEVAGELATNVASDQSGLAESAAAARSSANGRVALNTADAYASYGENSTAMELYNLALEKGGVDAGVVNLRKGALYYSMGQMAEARSSFEAVTGDRQPHAAFWLRWMDQQAAPAPAAEPASAE